jgi:nonsense-mediated mRNA decay protein 3
LCHLLPNPTDAQWVWTEPHSRRLKVKLLLEMEAVNGALIQQSMITEFVIRTLNCEYCTKEEMDQAWTTVVQVRQKVDHKRTLLFLEQVILQNRASASAQSMQVVANGMGKFACRIRRVAFATCCCSFPLIERCAK